MKARIIIFAGLFIVMAIYCLMTLIDELQAAELRWLWIVIYAAMLGVCVARSVQLTRDLIRLMKEEEKSFVIQNSRFKIKTAQSFPPSRLGRRPTPAAAELGFSGNKENPPIWRTPLRARPSGDPRSPQRCVLEAENTKTKKN